MKEFKFFPIPNTEIRISVTSEMLEDYKKCYESASNGVSMDCSKCSWDSMQIDGLCMCQLRHMERLIKIENV